MLWSFLPIDKVPAAICLYVVGRQLHCYMRIVTRVWRKQPKNIFSQNVSTLYKGLYDVTFSHVTAALIGQHSISTSSCWHATVPFIKSLVFDETIHILCEIAGYHSGVTDDSNLLECDAASLGEKFPTLQRTIFMVCLNVKIKTVRSFEESGKKIIRPSSVISQKT